MKPTAPPHSVLAYKNEPFLDSDDARPLRILAEYMEPVQAFHRQGVRGKRRFAVA